MWLARDEIRWGREEGQGWVWSTPKWRWGRHGNATTREAVAGWEIWGQPRLPRETLLENKTKQNNKQCGDLGAVETSKRIWDGGALGVGGKPRVQDSRACLPSKAPRAPGAQASLLDTSACSPAPSISGSSYTTEPPLHAPPPPSASSAG
jgi:hypothetical protein